MNKKAPTGQTGIYNRLDRSETAQGRGRRLGEGLSSAARLASSRVGRRDGRGSRAKPASTAPRCKDARVQHTTSNSMTTMATP